VERTCEQCCLGYRNSQKDGGGVRWDKHTVRVQIINKCKAMMASRRLYKKRSPHEGGGERRNRKITVDLE